MSLKKIAVVTGSSRGIGKHIAQRLARDEYLVVITGKTTTGDKGSIYSVVDEIEKLGGEAFPVPLDLQKTDSIENLARVVKNEFGKLDVLVNNASAMWWANIEHTPSKKYDLINNINARGSYLVSRQLVNLMPPGSHILTHSPPIDPISMKMYLEHQGFKNKVGYMVSKLGMSIVASGLAQELASQNIASNCIWPSTAIESAAMKDNKLISKKFNNPKLWRKPEIISDMVSELVKEPTSFTNNFLIDELYLKSKGYSDFDKYQCVPGFEPPKLIDLFRE